MLFDFFCLLNLVVASSTLSDKANSAFVDLSSAADSADSEVKSHTDATTQIDGSDIGQVRGSLGPLNGQIRQTNGLVRAWGNSPGYEKNGLDSETIQESFDALASLFSSLTHAHAALYSTGSSILPNIVYAVNELVSDLSPRFDCDELESWDSLETMLYSMQVMIDSYSLTINTQSSLLGSCSPSWATQQKSASGDSSASPNEKSASGDSTDSATQQESAGESNLLGSNGVPASGFSLWVMALLLA